MPHVGKHLWHGRKPAASASLGRLLQGVAFVLLLGLPAEARCTNYGSLATFDARKHTNSGADFDDGKKITRFVVETEVGLLPVQVSSPRNAEDSYFRDGTGKPMPVSVSIDRNACQEGRTRLFVRQFYRKLPMKPPFPFTAPLDSPQSAATVEALARTILQATHCRDGEIGLNTNFTYIDERGLRPKKLSAPALQLLGPGYGDTVWSVHLTCSAWRER